MARPTESGEVAGRSFFARPAIQVAPDLLGTRLVSQLGGVCTSGTIIEVEAYPGPEDPASHAACRIGRTERNAPMFGPPGQAYIHINYGVHHCLNVVVDRWGHPAAVLIRSLAPREGQSVMKDRRGHENLTGGPGRLTQALGIDQELQGHPLCEPPLQIFFDPSTPSSPPVERSARIGISRGREAQLRFCWAGHPRLSSS